MIYVGISRHNLGQPDAIDISQKGIISCRSSLPVSGPIIEILQLDVQNSGLDSIEAAVEAEVLVVIFLVGAIIANTRASQAYRLIVGGDNPPVTIGAQIFPRIEAESRGPAQASGPTSVMLCPVCLAGIFEKIQFTLLGQEL